MAPPLTKEEQLAEARAFQQSVSSAGGKVRGHPQSFARPGPPFRSTVVVGPNSTRFSANAPPTSIQPEPGAAFHMPRGPPGLHRTQPQPRPVPVGTQIVRPQVSVPSIIDEDIDMLDETGSDERCPQHTRVSESSVWAPASNRIGSCTFATPVTATRHNRVASTDACRYLDTTIPECVANLTLQQIRWPIVSRA